MPSALDYEQIELDLQHAPGIKLIKAENAALIITFLHRQFKQEQRVSIPLGELAERLEDFLEERNEHEPRRFARTAQAYINEWADEHHRYIRIIAPTPGRNERPLVELTADSERTIGWLEEMHAQSFVGTESRFLLVVQMLRDMVQRSTEDPALRLEQLEQQRDQLQQQIEAIRELGKVDDLYTSTQLRERFLEASALARQLLRDFRLVEDRFRDIARSIQEAQLQPGARKGSLVEFVLDADAELKSSDQGRSFYTFWEFLMAPTRQDELYSLLREVNLLPDVQTVVREGTVLRHLPSYLVAAGEKVVQSNYRLAEQLRRMLDEQSIAERRRVRELALEIKQIALTRISDAPDEATFLELEGLPDVFLAMERALWEPGETLSFDELPVNVDDIDLSSIDLSHLYSQFYVDEAVLREHIDTLLALQPEITLTDLLTQYPVEKGLSEILTYCAIAAQDARHLIDSSVRERIPLSGAPERTTDTERFVTVPRIVYRRSAHEE